MKKFKLVLWIIILAFVLLIFFQNKAFFTSKQSFFIDIYVIDAYQGDIVVAFWFLATLAIGVLITYFLALLEKFRINKVIKGMKANMDAQEKMIAEMKQQLGVQSGYPTGEVIDAETVSVSAPPSEMPPPVNR